MAARNLLRRAAYAAACGHRFPVPVPSGALAGPGSRSIGAAAQVCSFPTSCKPLLLPASCAKASSASLLSAAVFSTVALLSTGFPSPLFTAPEPLTPALLRRGSPRHRYSRSASIDPPSLFPKKFRLFPLLILESVFSPLVHSDFGIGNGL